MLLRRSCFLRHVCRGRVPRLSSPASSAAAVWPRYDAAVLLARRDVDGDSRCWRFFDNFLGAADADEDAAAAGRTRLTNQRSANAFSTTY